MRRSLFVLLAIAVIPAAAQAQYAFRVLNVVNPHAQISVTQSGSYRQGYKNYECISFVNLASKTVSEITFDFLHFDAQKKFIGSDTLTRSGSFANGQADLGPFKEIDLYSHVYAPGMRFDLSDYKNCILFSFPRNGIAFDVVTVRRVHYADGTLWEAPPDATPSAQPSPVPAASP